MNNQYTSFATPKAIRQNTIGSSDGSYLQGPFGKKPVVYADSTASGKSLRFIEEYIQQTIMPFYANTHTEASATGLQTSKFREQARDCVRNAVNAPKNEYAVIFTGSGSTSAIDKFSCVLGLSQHVSKDFTNNPFQQPIVFVGPYEHHSNEVLWRETQAKVIVIPECPSTGSIDTKQLERELQKFQKHHLKIGSFSAASNVTGIQSDTKMISNILHRYNALACFDFAAAGPHVTMDMKRHDIDVMYLSTHKFVGGPQTPGILIARQHLFTKFSSQIPTVPGGGTVDYVQPHSQSYNKDVEHREEGGTPAIIESIRAGLVLQLHSMVDHADGWIERTEAKYLTRALSKWKKNDNIVLMGNVDSQRVPIVSFMIKVPGNVGGQRDLLHYNYITALLNDLFGIQSRGGCSCAGPYAHLLWSVDKTTLDAIGRVCLNVQDGMVLKPGWARVAFSYYMDDATVDYIIDAVDMIARDGYKLLPWYQLVPETTMWKYIGSDNKLAAAADLWNFQGNFQPSRRLKAFYGSDRTSKQRCLKKARKVFRQLSTKQTEFPSQKTVLSEDTEDLRWFVLPEDIVPVLLKTTGSVHPIRGVKKDERPKVVTTGEKVAMRWTQ